jgi:hypothetical protein
MNQFEMEKGVIMLRPQLKNNGAFANNTYVDTMGFGGRLRVEFHVGDTDVAVGSGDDSTPPKLEECDTTGGTYTDITGAALSAVIADTDDNKMKAIEISLRAAHKRYVRVNAPTAGNGATGANLEIVGRLSGASVMKSAADQGLDELVQV